MLNKGYHLYRPKLLSDIAKRGLVVPTLRNGAPDTDQRELFIANNFVPSVASLITARDHKRQYGVNCHRHLYFINKQDWLSKVNPVHLPNSWGQKLTDYAPNIQKLFIESNPHISRTNLLSWGDILRLKIFCLEELEREFGVIVFQGDVANPRILNEREVSLEIVSDNSTTITPLILPRDTTLYHLERVFTQPLANPCPNHTVLYEMPLDNVPRSAVIIGSGLSTAWLVNRFPNTEFIVLKRSEDAPSETILTGKWYNEPNVRFITVEQSKIDLWVSDHEKYAIVSGIDNKIPIYSATGAKYAPTPEYGFTGKKILGTHIEEAALDSKKLFAGTNVIPTGSFAHSLCLYMQQTGNQYQEISGITYHIFCDNIIDTCTREGLHIDEEKKLPFFEQFQQRSEQLGHAPNTRQELEAILMESYKDIEQNSTNHYKFSRIASHIVDDYIEQSQHPENPADLKR